MSGPKFQSLRKVYVDSKDSALHDHSCMLIRRFQANCNVVLIPRLIQECQRLRVA